MASNTHPDRTPTPGSDIPRIPTATSAALELLNHRWVPQLLYLLCQGDARFSDLADALPRLSRRVLTDRLRALAAEGLIHRGVTEGPPTRITYQLTTLGEQLQDTFTELDAWAADYHPTPADH
jgi:DNA-binding HxlR family transcriptional regulator